MKPITSFIKAKQNASLLADKTKQLYGVVNVNQYGIVPSSGVGVSTAFNAMISTLRTNVINNGLTQFYTVEIPSGKYIIDQQINVSPYIKFKSLGLVIFEVTFSGSAFWIAPQTGDPTYSIPYYLNKNVWNRGDYFDGSNGAFVFETTLDITTNSPIGIEIGSRDNTVSSFIPTSRYTLNNVNIFGLDTAIKLNAVNNYIGTFKHCHIEGNNHAFWFYNPIDGTNTNSGENFLFENCIIAGQKKESIYNQVPGHDLTFENCSFDFNASPVFRSIHSGNSIRLNNCYLEKIGDGTGDEYIYSCESTLSGETNGRNSFYAKNFIVYLKRPSLLFKNVPNSGNGYINLYLDIDGLELRYQDTTRLQPYNIADRFLVNSPNVILKSKKILNMAIVKSLVSPDINMMNDGGFTKSTLNADLSIGSNTNWSANTTYTVNTQVNSNGNTYKCTTAGTSGNTAPSGTGTSISDGTAVWTYVGAYDPYWWASFMSNITHPTITSDGNGGTNGLKWTINTPGNNSMKLQHNFMYKVEAGERILLSCLVKTDKVSSGDTINYRLECYDQNNYLLQTLNYYDNLGSGAMVSMDGTQYQLPRDVGTFYIPAETVNIKPYVILTNLSGTFAVIDDIHLSKAK